MASKQRTDRLARKSRAVVSWVVEVKCAILEESTRPGLRRFVSQKLLRPVGSSTRPRGEVSAGPIWAAVIILARVGSAMAAELGTMAVNEEVDALRSMSIDPVRFLVMPRIMALVITMPLLTAIADFVGMLGGALIAQPTFGLTVSSFFDSAKEMLVFSDVFGGLIKSVFFACLIGTISCDQGLNTSDGAEGVGKSTTRAVVLSVIFVLLMDLFLTSFVQLAIKRF